MKRGVAFWHIAMEQPIGASHEPPLLRIILTEEPGGHWDNYQLFCLPLMRLRGILFIFNFDL